MTRKQIIQYLVGLIQQTEPNFQFVNAYLDGKATPVPGTNWASLDFINNRNVGWSQHRPTAYDSATGIITLSSDLLRIARIQFDYYGPDAADNADNHNHILMDALNGDPRPDIGLRGNLSDTRDLTELMPDKKWGFRYSFDCELYVINTIIQKSPAIENFVIEKIIRAN